MYSLLFFFTLISYSTSSIFSSLSKIQASPSEPPSEIHEPRAKTLAPVSPTTSNSLQIHDTKNNI